VFAAACQNCHRPSPAGAELLWGGKPLLDHTIPECYGAIQPTAVFVPLQAMRDPEVFKLVTTEVFGPFQVITEYTGGRGGG
jgi:1-pyrroline-5-carboxylate dehydrogenase